MGRFIQPIALGSEENESGSPLLRPALFLAAFTAIKNSRYGLLGLYATIDLRLKSAIGGASPGSYPSAVQIIITALSIS